MPRLFSKRALVAFWFSWLLCAPSLIIWDDFSLPAAHAGEAVYIYDSLGRLKAVIDPATDAAIYNYDAVGNLLSITRQSSSVVSIIDFSPKAGPVGTDVSIYGTGFSTTPSQNTVTFNGVAATVTSSTTTQIVTTVPASATTGVIGVTAPGGSATSTQVFTVTDSTAAPTITGFTPNIGTPGTPVTVTGTSFQGAATQNKVRFNNTGANVSSSTSTSIATSVPTMAGSGHIAVRTPFGSAVSAGDFFIPPSPYGPADVEFTGRMAVGATSQTVTISTSTKIGLVVFDGIGGQHIDLGVNSSSFTCCSNVLAVFNPDGTTLVSNTNFGTGTNLDTTLPVTGTYTIFIDPSGSNTGSMTLTLSEEIDAGTIAINGGSVPVTINRVGQRAHLTFSGTQNQVVSLAVSNPTFSSWMYVYKPDGSELTHTCCVGNGTTLDMVLPATGTYKILVNPDGLNTGSETLTLSEEIDAGTIVVDGSSVTATTTRIGQRARMTFDGTAGQIVSLGVNSLTLTNPDLYVYKPDGTEVTHNLTTSTSTNFHMTLSTTGTYKILVNPDGLDTGSITLTLSSEVNAGTVTINGGSVPATISRVGQRARLTFSGTAIQQATVRLTSNSMASVTVSLLRPDGTQLTSATSSAASFNLATQTLPATGTYTVLVDPVATNTGSINVAVTNP